MATPKQQPTRAISVIISPLNNIPNPALEMASGIAVSIEFDNTITCDGTVDFLAIGLKAGDILYIPGAGAATVISVIDSNTFVINSPYSPSAPLSPLELPYKLYNGENNNQGCVLYVGTDGSVETITAGGDVAVYTNVSGGTIIPVQTIAVTGGSASDIVALF